MGIPIKAALNMTPKGIMAKTTVTPKDIETQHLKLSNAVYRDFFVREMASLYAVIKLGAQSSAKYLYMNIQTTENKMHAHKGSHLSAI